MDKPIPKWANLSPDSVSLAFLHLVNPEFYQLTPELEELNQQDWMILAALLKSLEEEKNQLGVH